MERFIIEEAEPDSNGIWEIRTMNLYYHYQAKIRQVVKVLVIVVAQEEERRRGIFMIEKDLSRMGLEETRMMKTITLCPPPRPVEVHVIVAVGGGGDMLSKRGGGFMMRDACSGRSLQRI